MSIFDFLDEHGIAYENKDLIEQAFIHSSYVNEHKVSLGNNERLEFMGDAVLQIYSAERLYKIEPALPEGLMSVRRSNLVSEKALAQIVRENELNDFLKLGMGEEKTGGRDRDSLISDMFEAFIGAVYLDQGLETVYRLLDQLMTIHIKEVDEKTFDFKTRLQEYVQADSRKSIIYETVSVEGPNNAPEFEVAVKIDGLIYGYGKGTTKKQAQKNAAKDALEKLAQL
ncbi:MAG: ribonuclease III [Erysipelotrichaceae bacterium]|jgi:ribonuclease-3|nr:ribonuclease III [Erysipelotrichaceae bacterium]